MRRNRSTWRRSLAPSASGHALLITIGLAVAGVGVAGTSASYTASNRAPASSYATDAVYPPSAVAATGAGNSVALSWAAGSLGSGQSTFTHRVRTTALGVESGTRDGLDAPTSSCNSATSFSAFTTLGTLASNVTTHTHSNVATSPADGRGSWQCYFVDTLYTQNAASWSSQTVNSNQVALVQLGNVVQSVVFVDGPITDTGTFGQGDQVVVTFAQPIDSTTGPTGGFCARGSKGTLYLGRTAADSSGCGNNETVWLGQMVGIGLAPNNTSSAWPASWAWSNCNGTACRTLTGTAGARSSGNADITFSVAPANPHGLFIASTVNGKLVSSSGGVAICTDANTATSTCMPVPSGEV